MSSHSIDTDLVERIRARLSQPVVLIGLMGAGKSRLGRMLADALALPFTDSDDEVEKAAGMSISEIFERFGEPSFRDGEHRVIKRLLLEEGAKVVATGGGAVMREDTAEIVFSKTLSLWVRADIDVMIERVGRTDKRPLLRDGDPATILEGLMEKRYPVYGKADIIIESHNGPAEAILNQALSKLHTHLIKKAR